MTPDAPHIHRVEIYYEDTDVSGLVYHANYLKYFERAREHLIGRPVLVSLLEDQGIGFVVYKASMTFKKGAKLGDVLEIRTTAERTSPWRVSFVQNVWRVTPGTNDDQPLVEGLIEMVCVDAEHKLVQLPELGL